MRAATMCAVTMGIAHWTHTTYTLTRAKSPSYHQSVVGVWRS